MPNEAGSTRIGILALQGGYALHARKLEALGVMPILVRKAEELATCEGLILPGGESTTISSLLAPWRNALHHFAQEKPLLGTCAGLILMVKENLLSIAVSRNAYGRQADSFATTLLFREQKIEAIFIRAPKIKAILSPDVKVLAHFQGEPVFVEQGKHLALSFHPELSSSNLIHQYFMEKVDLFRNSA